jgi:glutamate racemase
LTGAVKTCVEPLVEAGVDCIILGCTHYPLVCDAVQTAVADIKLIDPARAVADLVAEVLEKNDQLNLSGDGADRVYVSGDPGKFVNAASALGFEFGVTVKHADSAPVGAPL